VAHEERRVEVAVDVEAVLLTAMAALRERLLLPLAADADLAEAKARVDLGVASGGPRGGSLDSGELSTWPSVLDRLRPQSRLPGLRAVVLGADVRRDGDDAVGKPPVVRVPPGSHDAVALRYPVLRLACCLRALAPVAPALHVTSLFVEARRTPRPVLAVELAKQASQLFDRVLY
jgi:hypothetical protein